MRASRSALLRSAILCQDIGDCCSRYRSSSTLRGMVRVDYYPEVLIVPHCCPTGFKLSSENKGKYFRMCSSLADTLLCVSSDIITCLSGHLGPGTKPSRRSYTKPHCAALVDLRVACCKSQDCNRAGRAVRVKCLPIIIMTIR